MDQRESHPPSCWGRWCRFQKANKNRKTKVLKNLTINVQTLIINIDPLGRPTITAIFILSSVQQKSQKTTVFKLK